MTVSEGRRGHTSVDVEDDILDKGQQRVLLNVALLAKDLVLGKDIES